MNFYYQKFLKALSVFPIPGEGGMSHNYLMTPANYAKLADLSPDRAIREISAAIPTNGKRQIDISEVEDAVEKAYSTEIPKGYRSQKSRPKQHSNQEPDFEAFIEGFDATEDDIIALSPIAVKADPLESSIQLLNLYKPYEYIFVGPRHGAQEYVKTSAEWEERLKEIVQNDEVIDLPHIMPNPLTGKPGVTGTGKESYRADDCIANFRFAIAEMDSVQKEKQYSFWSAAISKGFPVAALIDSGGKSIHGWLAVRCRDRTEWEELVENRLFPELLVPLGCDPACRNESRMSRLPGEYREEKDKHQRLLYLNPGALND